MQPIRKSKSMNLTAIQGVVKPILDRVIVRDMHFGDMQSKGGIFMMSDDGKDIGIKPRWAKVVSKGPDNNDDYQEGDWIFIEHGRWSRGFAVDMGEDEPVVLRTVDAACVLLFSDVPPSDDDLVYFNKNAEFNNDVTVKPEEFAEAMPGMPGGVI